MFESASSGTAAKLRSEFAACWHFLATGQRLNKKRRPLGINTRILRGARSLDQVGQLPMSCMLSIETHFNGGNKSCPQGVIR